MDYSIDTSTISEAGFDEYLNRKLFDFGLATQETTMRYTDANSLVGGTIGSEGIIYLGSQQIKLDGKNKRIIVNDGVNDRILIGYQKDGF